MTNPNPGGIWRRILTWFLALLTPQAAAALIAISGVSMLIVMYGFSHNTGTIQGGTEKCKSEVSGFGNDVTVNCIENTYVLPSEPTEQKQDTPTPTTKPEEDEAFIASPTPTQRIVSSPTEKVSPSVIPTITIVFPDEPSTIIYRVPVYMPASPAIPGVAPTPFVAPPTVGSPNFNLRKPQPVSTTVIATSPPPTAAPPAVEPTLVAVPLTVEPSPLPPTAVPPTVEPSPLPPTAVPPTVEPSPLPTKQPECVNENPERDLTGKIFQDQSGWVANRSVRCWYYVGMASYMKTSNVIDEQVLFHHEQRWIAPGEKIILSVQLPACAVQVDLFYGEVLGSLRGVRYGDRLLDARHIGKTYCNP